MALGKKKKNKTQFKSVFYGRDGKQQSAWLGPSLIKLLEISIVICFLLGTVIGLAILDSYVKTKTAAASENFDLILINVPSWVTEQVQMNVLAITKGDGQLSLDENTAQLVQRRIDSKAAWIYDVQVQTTHESILIEAKWRKPIAMFKRGMEKFYLDTEQVVLDFVPMPGLSIVEVKGLSLIMKAPPLGQVWRRDDLTAAVTILDRLDRMDKAFTPDKPLLVEIASIDVSNFGGRENNQNPHIVLYAKDSTEIIWGAEFGTWQQNLESTDEQKLAKLYGYYKEAGTLLGGAKYINLRDPRYKVPLPIDKY
jgi:hypothetical protein